MTRHAEGWDRSQTVLLPERAGGCVDENHRVRAVAAFVDELDLAKLGFTRAVPAETGRPAYHPAVMLKLCLCGYLNRIPSSRRFEQEAQRNIELVWLTGRLAPDFKTIADFRRDNGPAIRATCRQFVMLCRKLNLFSDALVAIDGSKFKAVNTRDKNYTPAAIKRRIQQVEASISRYTAALDTADRQEPDVVPGMVERLQERLGRLRAQVQHLRGMEVAVEGAPDDWEQLATMARLAQDAVGRKDLTVLADRGCFSG